MERRERLLVGRFSQPRQTLSWAIWNGGRGQSASVAWVEVSNAELPIGVDPRRLCQERLRGEGLGDALGFLTSRRLDRYEEASAELDGVCAKVVATVGLSNAVRVGDSPGSFAAPSPVPAIPVGTINLLAEVSVPLSEEAALEALSVVIEARTAAVTEVAFPSRRSGQPATGTGTDCVALAWPAAPAGSVVRYAGKHTALGHVLGEASLRAVSDGVVRWMEEYRCRLG